MPVISTMVITYAVYLLLSLFVTVWVGRSLHKNGRVFLVANFHGREALADSVNHLLLVGFYLINIGFVSLALRYGGQPQGLVDAIEYLSTKIGLVIVVIGVMHFNNVYALIKLRNSRLFSALQTGSNTSQTEPPPAA
jgi:TRAP-type C4-dicarboxylate transport system permease large subunit